MYVDVICQPLYFYLLFLPLMVICSNLDFWSNQSGQHHKIYHVVPLECSRGSTPITLSCRRPDKWGTQPGFIWASENLQELWPQREEILRCLFIPSTKVWLGWTKGEPVDRNENLAHLRNIVRRCLPDFLVRDPRIGSRAKMLRAVSTHWAVEYFHDPFFGDSSVLECGSNFPDRRLWILRSVITALYRSIKAMCLSRPVDYL